MKWPFSRYPTLETVLVSTKTDKCFRGVLWRRGSLLVLKNAEMLRNREEPVPMDGELVIMADNVDFIQVVN